MISKLDRLLEKYEAHIKIPWRDDMATSQKVIFCIYDPKDELKFRHKVTEFELATRRCEKKWVQIDLTDTFSSWLTSVKYHENYFNHPNLLINILDKYRPYIKELALKYLENSGSDDRTVVALTGVGSLFSLIKVKQVVDEISPHIKGRLVVFFPGNYENNNYRLLDGYDGWNYLAIPISADNQF